MDMRVGGYPYDPSVDPDRGFPAPEPGHWDPPYDPAPDEDPYPPEEPPEPEEGPGPHDRAASDMRGANGNRRHDNGSSAAHRRVSSRA